MDTPAATSHEETLRALDAGIDLARQGTPTREALERLGEGWVDEEALVIAVACALGAATGRTRSSRRSTTVVTATPPGRSSATSSVRRFVSRRSHPGGSTASKHARRHRPSPSTAPSHSVGQGWTPTSHGSFGIRKVEGRRRASGSDHKRNSVSEEHAHAPRQAENIPPPSAGSAVRAVASGDTATRTPSSRGTWKSIHLKNARTSLPA